MALRRHSEQGNGTDIDERNAAFALALVFGVLLGWVGGVSASNSPEFWHVGLADLLMPASAVSVGWWINASLRRRGQLNAVAIGYLTSLNERISELISDALGGREEEQVLVPVRQLSREISWLLAILDQLRPELRPSLRDRLHREYFSLKKHVTDTHDRIQAAEAGHELRLVVFYIHWRICEHVLKQPKAVNSLLRTRRTDGSFLEMPPSR